MRFLCMATVLMTLVLINAPVTVANSLQPPEGRVLLTVEGKIEHTNRGQSTDFDRKALEALGMKTVAVVTPWTKGDQAFEGVPLQVLLQHVGASGDRLVAVALNDYKVVIPVTDAAAHNVLLAMKLNGKDLSVREKGPIWIIYPHQGDPNAIPDVHASRMVWQLRTLKVE